MINIKQTQRATARRQRTELAAAATIETAQQLAASFIAGPLGAFAGKQPVIAGFWPFGSEIDTRPLLFKLENLGYRLALPVVMPGTRVLTFRRWQFGMELTADGANILASPPSSPELQPDLLITPCLAFDRAGNRLGYGGGYYDATLAELRRERPIVAALVAYAGQEVPRVATDARDEKVDWIVTEQGSHPCDPDRCEGSEAIRN